MSAVDTRSASAVIITAMMSDMSVLMVTVYSASVVDLCAMQYLNVFWCFMMQTDVLHIPIIV